MIDQITVGQKVDTPEKIAATAQLPDNAKMPAAELNEIVAKIAAVITWINSYVPVDVAGKIDTTAIYNALDQVAAGRVLDARQGKVLNDLIVNKTLAPDFESLPTNLQKIPNISSLRGWKNTLAFWKSTAFAGTSTRLLQASATGDISAAVEILAEDIYVTDNDIITACTAATFNAGNNFTATITPVNAKTLKAGQFTTNGNYKYEAKNDNIVMRIPLG